MKVMNRPERVTLWHVPARRDLMVMRLPVDVSYVAERNLHAFLDLLSYTQGIADRMLNGKAILETVAVVQVGRYFPLGYEVMFTVE